ncbi:MAG: pyruvate dehydrogenase complex dihydrolipoamide acetyltransferase [Sphingomonas sp.]|nr:pyruvate dehydrogenase complex dihydrolipoamide acetyltransferase [Sphingomonas sp.]
MPIELKMPALSPTMEEGTLAKWLVKEGDTVASGDVLAEIETDKATMEFEAVDEGTIAKIVIAEGTDGVKVGEVIALIAEEGEDASAAAAPAPKTEAKKEEPKAEAPAPAPAPKEEPKAEAPSPAPAPAAKSADGDRVKASPLARRLAEAQGIDLAGLSGTGPGGRIVKADIESASGKAPAKAPEAAPAVTPSAAVAAPAAFDTEIPHEAVKLSNMRKTIARRLTEAKQTIPHIYLTVDVRLDALLKLRSQLNASLEARGVKLSVNDMLIKALAVALIEVPECNVSISGDQLFKYNRADISVAVSIPGGLITPIIQGANTKALSAIATEMKDLAARAREGKLQPHEYQGGTASISNMGMYGITQFDAVINPPQAMIMAIGAGEKRPTVIDDSLQIATIMSVTGSFDHRAIDGADGARLMQTFKKLVEDPMGMLA